LSTIAAFYNTTVRNLWRNNFFLGGNPDVYPGQILVISYLGPKLGSAFCNGYAYPFINDSLLSAQLPYLSTLTPFTYGITESGSLLPLDDDALLAAARRRGVLPVLHLSTLTEEGTFDTARGQRILSDSEVQERLVADIMQTALRKGYVGVDVDFEYLPGSLASSYGDFLSRLQRLLHAQGLFLWAALAPKTSSQQRGLLYEGHDYAAVGAAVDGVLLMTYEWGYTYGPPLAVAPLASVRRVLDFAVSEIPAEKIFMGLPNYGYDWTLPYKPGETRARSIGNEEALAIARQFGAEIRFDEASQTPFFHYNDGGVQHEVWFEDARSYLAKLRLIEEYGFAGAGIWNAMRPFTQGYLVLQNLYHVVAFLP
jgi:spore germination protein